MMAFEANPAGYSLQREHLEELPISWRMETPIMDQSNTFGQPLGFGASVYQSNDLTPKVNESDMNNATAFEYGRANKMGLNDDNGDANNSGMMAMGMAQDVITNHSPNPESQYEDQMVPNNYTAAGSMPGLSVGFAIGLGADASLDAWEQTQTYPTSSSDILPFNQSLAVTVGNNMLGLFVPTPGLDNTGLGTSSAPEVMPTQGTPLLRVDDPYAQQWQTDGISPIGYADAAARVWKDNSFGLQSVSQVPFTDTSGYNAYHTTSAAIPQTTMAPSFNDDYLFGPMGLAGTSSNFAIPPAQEDGQLSQHSHSRAASSVGNWESPRTPLSLDYNNSPPIGYGQNWMMPGQHNEQPTTMCRVEVISEVMVGPMLPKMDELTGNFAANPEPLSNKRKRNAYTVEGKRKVNAVREKGACVSCHARKIECSPNGVCKHCHKTTGDPALASEICLRDKMRDIYVGVKDLHKSLDDRKQRLVPLLASLIGNPKPVSLTIANARDGYAYQIHLQVTKCSASPSCRWKRLRKTKGIYVTHDIIYDERYVIVPESLPSIEEFDFFGRKILSSSNGSHSGELTRLLDDFLLGYFNRSQTSRLRGFVNSTLRIASLNRLVAHGFLNLSDGSYDLLGRPHLTDKSLTRRYVSETVYDQLRLLAAEGLEQIEAFTFTEVDNLYKIMKTGKNGRIVAGVCVLRLMLLYRDRLIRDSIRLELPNHGIRHQERLEKAAFMYKRLTITYGTLCRETTPLSMSWVPELGGERTADDVATEALFVPLQPAFEDFCNEHLTPRHDYLLRGLIIEAPKNDHRPTKKQKQTTKKSCTTSSDQD